MISVLFAAVALFAAPAAAAPAPGTAREAGDTDAVAWAAYQRIHSDFFDLDKAVKSDPREIELGRQLFFDPRLSGNGAMSCATCHDPSRAWGDADTVRSDGRSRRSARPVLRGASRKHLRRWDAATHRVSSRGRPAGSAPSRRGRTG